MYELGYAMALKREYVIISQNVESLPFDIKNIRTILYKNSWSGIEELVKKLDDYLEKSQLFKNIPKKNTSKAVQRNR